MGPAEFVAGRVADISSPACLRTCTVGGLPVPSARRRPDPLHGQFAEVGSWRASMAGRPLTPARHRLAFAQMRGDYEFLASCFRWRHYRTSEMCHRCFASSASEDLWWTNLSSDAGYRSTIVSTSDFLANSDIANRFPIVELGAQRPMPRRQRHWRGFGEHGVDARSALPRNTWGRRSDRPIWLCLTGQGCRRECGRRATDDPRTHIRRHGEAWRGRERRREVEGHRDGQRQTRTDTEKCRVCRASNLIASAMTICTA